MGALRKDFRSRLFLAAFSFVLLTTWLATAASAFALPMTVLPASIQTTNTAPEPRRISLKLPVRQADPFWKFPNRAAFLEGKLTLRISRSTSTNTIVIFDRGQLQDGWGDMPLPRAVAGEMYFGFKSSKKYPTAPGDRLELELEVKQDLKCVGPSRQGVLSAGTYRSSGTYSALLDDYRPNPGSKPTTPETLNLMRQMYNFTALLQNWQEQWGLRITSEKGWLPPTRELGTERIKKVIKVASRPDNTMEIEHAPPGPEPARGARGIASP